MAANRSRRIGKELIAIHEDKQAHITAEPLGGGDDLTHLRGSFPGPPGTPYEGGEYYIDIRIPPDYPFKPPAMRFETRVWHPNVSSQTVRPWLLQRKEGVLSAQIADICFRVLSASIHWAVLGHRYSRSSRRCFRFSRC